MPLKFKLDHEKNVLLSNFERKNWSRAHADDEWNIYWASPRSTKMLFHHDNPIRLSDFQVVNHFPNHFELTRKDLMVKNIKRYKKELDKVHAERNEGSTLVTPRDDLDLLPTTFILPQDFLLLTEEFKRSPGDMWIMKPISKSRGIGIFIVSRLSQLRKWISQRPANASTKDMYVCSRYIANPLLVGGKKFDLRLYVLVLSYRPLKVYVYRRGFARFCTYNYTTAAGELDNDLVHLTNVAIQKQSASYSGVSHGWKWSLQNLLAYVEGTRGLEAAEMMMESIGWLIVHSLKAVQNVIINDKHSFECYGFDIMMDAQLKPWLLEVNASPSLSTTTTTDRLLKMQLIEDLLGLVVPPNFLELGRTNVGPRRSQTIENPDEELAGDFELLFDEAIEIEAERARRDQAEAKRKGAKSLGLVGRDGTRRSFVEQLRLASNHSGF